MGTFEVTLTNLGEPVLLENVTIEFTPHHVVFRRADGTIRLAWHQERVRELTEWRKQR